ncbi:serine hydrolase [Leptospira hartskeerlii]|uniref:Serine hydrolase n=1 Tax=Leptospira hartskeerlii TaxID=2023177 RepID=A0A2M9XB19_9LEPT|nr:serine hydrolase domain-containing protein [Leptospira hartskeerlii]PJZ24878.1 serine hydrolase [Leptospira hartskeerlii]PJZ33030.1 serine hydrolase [Leptospira hartskeerlii]
MRFISVLLIAVLTTSCTIKMNNEILKKDERIKDYLTKKNRSGDYPGIQYIVTSSNSILYNFNIGLADIKEKRPISESTTMMIYSMTKTFTAAAVLKLVDENKLSIDDSVEKYLPEIPYGNQLTIRHLLCQTSGIPNPIPLKWAHLVEEDSSYNEDATLKLILAKYPKLDFAPGKKYSYSNISYWILGKIIEVVSGMSYKEYMKSQIFAKLDLPKNDVDFVISLESNHAKGYLKRISFMNLLKIFVMDAKYFGDYEDSWLHIKNHYLNGSAFGGIVSSAQSVSVFLQDQLKTDSVLFSKKTKELFYEQQKDNDGKLIEMALGWHIGIIDSNKFYYKEGGGGGFHGEMRIYPSKGIATVVIANNTEFNARAFLDVVDREVFEK